MNFGQSQLSGSPHHFFAQLVGGWTGTTKLWLEPDVLTDESSVLGTITLVLEGRFAIYLYQGSITTWYVHLWLQHYNRSI